MTADPVVDIRQLSKSYAETPVFEGLSLQVPAGEIVAIIGESGVGKSSLLNCIAALEHWNQGQITVCGQNLANLDADGCCELRRDHIGFVFQAFHVLPHLSVQQNVALPLMLQGRPDPARVQNMLDAIGLGNLAQRLPYQLSGGQLQRVAVARALVHRPQLLLADEPTGNLDPTTAAQVMQLLVSQCREHGAAMLLVTHSSMAAGLADRVLHLRADGLHEN